MARLNPMRLVVGAVALFIVSATPAAAATIGLFSWQLDSSDQATLAIEVFPDAWPASLVLNDVYVQFTQEGGTSGEAFFDGVGPVDIEASTPALQVPGFGPGGLLPLPQDIVSARLNDFTWDLTLGIVSVAPLGPAFIEGTFTGEATLIDFESAPASLPEPSTLTLFATAFAALCVSVRRGRVS